MNKPRLLVLSLGGTITMVPSDSGGITPKLGAAELVASVPALAEVGDIDARSPFRLPSPSLTPANLVEVAGTIREAFASGFDGAVVIQGTDTIEESAFLLDLLVDSDKPVVITGAMRGADAPGADGPANLLSAAIVAASPGVARPRNARGPQLRHSRGAFRPEVAHRPALGVSLAAGRADRHPHRTASRASMCACRATPPCRPRRARPHRWRSSWPPWATTGACSVRCPAWATRAW